MSSRHSRPVSPPGRRFDNYGRSSTAQLNRVYDMPSSYSTRRESVTSPRSSAERVIPISSETYVNGELVGASRKSNRTSHENHTDRPRRAPYEVEARTVPSSTTSSQARIAAPVAGDDRLYSSASSKPSNYDSGYGSQASKPSNIRREHKKVYSIDDGRSSRVAPEREGRKRDDVDTARHAPLAGAGSRREYHTSAAPRDINDSGAYEYTDARGMYRDTEPKWRPRRGSLDGSKRERPSSMIIDPYSASSKASAREIGAPPPTTRGLDRIPGAGVSRTESLRSSVRSPPRNRDRGYSNYSEDDTYPVKPRISTTTVEPAHFPPERPDIYSPTREGFDDRREPRSLARRFEDAEVSTRGFGIRTSSADEYDTRVGDYGRHGSHISDTSSLPGRREYALEGVREDLRVPGWRERDRDLPKAVERDSARSSDRDLPPRGRDLPLNDRNLPVRDRELASRERDLPIRDRELASRERDLPIRDREVSSKERDLPIRDRELSSKERELPIRDRDLPPRERDIPPRDRELASRERDLPLRERELDLPIRDRDRDLASRERDPPAVDRDLAPRERDMPPRDRDLPLREREPAPKERDLPIKEGRLVPRERDFDRDRDISPRDRGILPPERELPQIERDMPRDRPLDIPYDDTRRARDRAYDREDSTLEDGRRPRDYRADKTLGVERDVDETRSDSGSQTGSSVGKALAGTAAAGAAAYGAKEAYDRRHRDDRDDRDLRSERDVRPPRPAEERRRDDRPLIERGVEDPDRHRHLAESPEREKPRARNYVAKEDRVDEIDRRGETKTKHSEMLDPDEEYRRRVQQEAERVRQPRYDDTCRDDESDRERRRRGRDERHARDREEEPSRYKETERYKRNDRDSDSDRGDDSKSLAPYEGPHDSVLDGSQFGEISVPGDGERENRVRIVEPPKEKEKPKGILRKPTAKFPEDPNPVREGVLLHKDAKEKPPEIPQDARWTKIDRRIVNPEALEEAKERFEERQDCVIVLRPMPKEEIQKYADRTKEIRGMDLLPGVDIFKDLPASPSSSSSREVAAGAGGSRAVPSGDGGGHGNGLIEFILPFISDLLTSYLHQDERYERHHKERDRDRRSSRRDRRDYDGAEEGASDEGNGVRPTRQLTWA